MYTEKHLTSPQGLIIIGGGLSGLAAGIRAARFGQKVLILEKHTKVGGLNSYYYRQGMLFETGLHAITNYASADKRQAPLNRLFRQLKIPRKDFTFRQQYASEILFGDCSLVFSNDFSQLVDEIGRLFPSSIDGFRKLVKKIDDFNPFVPQPWQSARRFLEKELSESLLIDMILCPLFFYGSCNEDDMDLAQFVIIFRSIFQEGFCRPPATMKDFLAYLVDYYKECGGEIRLGTAVREVILQEGRVRGVRLADGDELFCDTVLSTIGIAETAHIVPESKRQHPFFEEARQNTGRLSFVESISLVDRGRSHLHKDDRTIIFYNNAERFSYRRPAGEVDLSSGVICFADNFEGIDKGELLQLRATHLANYDLWKAAYDQGDSGRYGAMKSQWQKSSNQTVGKIIGKYEQNIVYDDFFTPITIERYTSKANGAIYGSSRKIKDGVTPLENLFIAGTDQGFLGIVGSMLSGISMVNQHFLMKS